MPFEDCRQTKPGLVELAWVDERLTSIELSIGRSICVWIRLRACLGFKMLEKSCAMLAKRGRQDEGSECSQQVRYHEIN